MHLIRETPDAARRTNPRAAGLVPPQHGAWAFMLLPVALGVAAGGCSWASVPVLLGWVALYPFSWALTNRLVAPRPERFNSALQLWSAVAVPLLVVSVVLHPWLLWIGSAYSIPFAANITFASVRRERSLANDALLILECTAAVPVVAALAAGRRWWSPPWDALVTHEVVLMTTTCLLVLIGSTLHVRSLIRERNNPRFTTASRAFAVVCVPAITGASVLAAEAPWLAVPFAALAVRAVYLHDPTWKPARIGLTELGGLILVAVFAAVTLG